MRIYRIIHRPEGFVAQQLNYVVDVNKQKIGRKTYKEYEVKEYWIDLVFPVKNEGFVFDMDVEINPPFLQKRYFSTKEEVIELLRPLEIHEVIE